MIKAENLVKKFDEFEAVKDISLTIDTGCIFGFVGSNGAGKSTLMRMLTGIYKPDSGKVLYDGVDVQESIDVKGKFVFVPDELFFLPGANIKRMANLYKTIYKNFSMDRLIELTDILKLSRTQRINTFSKGMKRQAATILALVSGAEYLLFDETFDGFDPVIRNFFKSVLCEEVEVRNATVIITSHSLRELEDICDQLALLHKGGMVLQSDIANLKTTQYKIQIAFEKEYNKDIFGDLQIASFSKHGLVASMIVKGEREEIMKQLQKMKPILLEILPLSLEEAFTYEMENLGYSYGIE